MGSSSCCVVVALSTANFNYNKADTCVVTMLCTRSYSLFAVLATHYHTAPRAALPYLSFRFYSRPSTLTMSPSSPSHFLACTHRSLVTLLPRLPATVSAALDAPLAALQAAALDAVSPMFRALVEAMEGKLIGMHALHKAHWGRGEQEPEAGMMDTSSYVADVVSSLAVFRCVASLGLFNSQKCLSMQVLQSPFVAILAE